LINKGLGKQHIANIKSSLATKRVGTHGLISNEIQQKNLMHCIDKAQEKILELDIAQMELMKFIKECQEKLESL
jgi:hypothetical protein